MSTYKNIDDIIGKSHERYFGDGYRKVQYSIISKQNENLLINEHFYKELPIFMKKISDNPGQSLLDMQHGKSRFNSSELLYRDFLENSFDMVAVGRPLLVNPNWINELENNHEI